MLFRCGLVRVLGEELVGGGGVVYMGFWKGGLGVFWGGGEVWCWRWGVEGLDWIGLDWIGLIAWSGVGDWLYPRLSASPIAPSSPGV